MSFSLLARRPELIAFDAAEPQLAGRIGTGAPGS